MKPAPPVTTARIPLIMIPSVLIRRWPTPAVRTQLETGGENALPVGRQPVESIPERTVPCGRIRPEVGQLANGQLLQLVAHVPRAPVQQVAGHPGEREHRV